MRIHMRFERSNKEHTQLTIFINGQNCGKLCIGTDDAVGFHQILAHGAQTSLDEFVSTGQVWSPPGTHRGIIEQQRFHDSLNNEVRSVKP